MEIHGFFAKLSSGCAAACSTRDVQRLASGVPMVRLWSHYYSAFAFYIHDVVVMHVTMLMPHLLALLALLGLDHQLGHSLHGILSLFALMPLLLAMASCAPALVMLVVEQVRTSPPPLPTTPLCPPIPLFSTPPLPRPCSSSQGARRSFRFMLGMLITLSPVYFIFITQSKSYHFSRTVTSGGARYYAPRRNASVLHTRFHTLYERFCESHFLVGCEALAMLLIAHIFSVSDRLLLATWSTWIIASCCFAAPFLYNPQQLEHGELFGDALGWLEWVRNGGWERWWRSSHRTSNHSSLSEAGHPWNQQLTHAAKASYYALIGYLIPIKAARPESLAAGSACDWRFVLAIVLGTLLLLPWVVADLDYDRSVERGALPVAVHHGAAAANGLATREVPGSPTKQGSSHSAPASAIADMRASRRRRRGYWLGRALLRLALLLALIGALLGELPLFDPSQWRPRRLLVAALVVYAASAAGVALLELLVMHVPQAASLLMLAHKMRDYVLSALIFVPLAVLGVVLFPAHIHRTLLFQRSFIDLDRRGMVIYSVAIGAAALVAALVAL